MSNYKLERAQDQLEIDLAKKLILVRATGTQGSPIIFNSHKMIDLTKKAAAVKAKFLKSFEEMVEEINEKTLLAETITYLTKKAGKILYLEDIPAYTKESHYRVDQPLSSLKEVLERYLEDDLNLEPDFQRNHVWTKQQQIAFLEYFLKEGKVSSIYFNNPSWLNFVGKERGPFVIVDGKQRLKAAVDFLDGKFRVFKDLDKEGKGFLYSEISRLPATLTFKFEVNTLKTRKEVLQWYLDLNTGGTQHKKAELEKVKELLKKEV